MKVAITGASGLFGHGLVRVFGARHTIFPLSHADVEISDSAAVRSVFEELRPEIVIHPAGIADPDVCEADPALATRVNVEGTRNVVEAARVCGARVVYISTDAVFDGTKQTPYVETDIPNPRSVYGRTKLQAEQIVRSAPEHWIFRVSVMFGPGKTNFVEKGLRKLAAGESYVVAADQIGSATYTLDAAAKMMEVIEAGRHGLFHLSNSGACSRLELAQRAAVLAGFDPAKVVGKPREEMGRRGPRPKYAVMEMAALKQAGFAPPRSWEDALAEYIFMTRGAQSEGERRKH